MADRSRQAARRDGAWGTAGSVGACESPRPPPPFLSHSGLSLAPRGLFANASGPGWRFGLRLQMLLSQED